MCVCVCVCVQIMACPILDHCYILIQRYSVFFASMHLNGSRFIYEKSKKIERIKEVRTEMQERRVASIESAWKKRS